MESYCVENGLCRSSIFPITIEKILFLTIWWPLSPSSPSLRWAADCISNDEWWQKDRVRIGANVVRLFSTRNLNKGLDTDFRSCSCWTCFLPYCVFKKLKRLNREKHENRAHINKRIKIVPHERWKESLVTTYFYISYSFQWKFLVFL